MKRFLAFAFTLFSVCVSFGAFAQDHIVRDIDITVTLSQDGTATIHEEWNIVAGKGTEWYLVRSNLGPCSISDLRVREAGVDFYNEGVWNIDRSMGEKAGRCGIVRKEDGCELCWGLGSYGPHLFEVEYKMTNLVEAMDDYDCLHIQFVSPGINPYPQHARVSIVRQDGQTFSSSNSAIWAFGFSGDINFIDGAVVANTDKAFDSDFESVIVMCRFEKGFFSPQTSIGGKFDDKLSKAFKDSDYEEYLKRERRENISVISIVIAMVVFFVGLISSLIRARNKKMFGVVKIKEIGYSREVPFGGEIFQSRYVLKQVSGVSDGNFAGALILKMIKDGYLHVATSAEGELLIGFVENKDLSTLSPFVKDFYDMLYQASGEDHILQEKEFSKWSLKMANAKRLSKWVEGLNGEGIRLIHENNYTGRDSYTPEGQHQCRNVIGFRKYLKDFTLSGERTSAEVTLWQDYLIFASLYGIAKKVAREMKDIDPKVLQENVGYDYVTMNRLVFFSHSMGNTMVGAVTKVQTGQSVAGGGGRASFGGGGGFHGGGFGGGAR